MEDNIIEVLPLELIITDDPFRDNMEDLELALHLSVKKLKLPLIVEGPTPEGKYILVEGYRRFEALKRIGTKIAKCIIEPLTTKDQRVMQRLATELHTRKRTSHEIEQMIEYLLNNGYTISDIVGETGCSTATIRKYIKLAQVDSQKRKTAAKNNVSTDALLTISGLELSASTKVWLESKLLRGEVSTEQAKAIAKVVKSDDFKKLSAKTSQSCLESIARDIKNKNDRHQLMLFKEKAKECFDAGALKSIVDNARKELRIATDLFVQWSHSAISETEKYQLYSIYLLLARDCKEFVFEYDPAHKSGPPDFPLDGLDQYPQNPQ